MLKNKRFIQLSGNMQEPQREKVSNLVKDFEAAIERIAYNIPPKTLRLKLDGSIFIYKDNIRIIVIYAPKQGNVCHFEERNEDYDIDNITTKLSNWNDYSDLVVGVISVDALDDNMSQRQSLIDAAAAEIVNYSLQQVQSMSGIASYSPIFGQNKFPVQNNLCFVIMPFKERLDSIYKSIIKPCIETDINFVCRRADEISSNNAIMHDIWKSICEAKFLIADLTEFNSNVMYELGISHTIGKPTIIIYQENDIEAKFPFDLSHIRRINYTDSASGGQKLRSDLRASVNAMLQHKM